MRPRDIFIATTFAASLVLFSNSCEDLGDELKTGLSASTLAVTLTPGGSATITISGGNPPYRITRNPDSTLASATLTNLNGRGELVITVPASVASSGTTEVRVRDSDDSGTLMNSPTHGEEIVISITVSVSPAGVSFSGQIQPIFTNNCVSRGCHPGGGAPFPLAQGQSYGNLVNAPATFSPCAVLRVKPFSADSSVLYRRVSGTSCGNQMPLGFPSLSPSDQNLIRSWINQGALNN